VAFSVDGALLASADEGYAKVWDVTAGKLLMSVEAPGIKGAAFSQDGKHLAIAADNVLVWEVARSK
jgi:hypothetical protein